MTLKFISITGDHPNKMYSTLHEYDLNEILITMNEYICCTLILLKILKLNNMFKIYKIKNKTKQNFYQMEKYHSQYLK